MVRTGTARVTVDDAGEAAAAVRALVEDADGFVADEQVRADEGTVTVTVRVPSAAYDAVLAGVGELGDVSEQDVEARM